MKNNFDQLKNEIEGIFNCRDILAVILVGSSVALEDKLCSDKDIDIFVIGPFGDNLEREVVEKKHVIWDITYLSKALFKKGISERWPFLIQGFAKNKPLIVRDKDIYASLATIKEIYEQGPGALFKEEIDYIRFKLTQGYEDLLKRKNDNLNARFLANTLFKEILNAYFKLNNQWTPGDKKILNQVKLTNQKLYNLCGYFLEEKNIEIILAYLQDMIKYVLNPWGGKLKYWPREKFPLK